MIYLKEGQNPDFIRGKVAMIDYILGERLEAATMLHMGASPQEETNG